MKRLLLFVVACLALVCVTQAARDAAQAKKIDPRFYGTFANVTYRPLRASTFVRQSVIDSLNQSIKMNADLYREMERN